MAKRYLGGGISFEQENVYQEFSESDTPGGGSLAALSDVDISNPADGQTLVYNAESGKWENGAGGGGFTALNGTIDPDTEGWIISNMTIGEFVVLNQPVLIHAVGYSEGLTSDRYALTSLIAKPDAEHAQIEITGGMQCSGTMDDPLVFVYPY